ncbi:hypothetical protein G5V57_18050 [Nordella sp. HKS 07]|uniref:hypothetical protein n=1 Tax=Nordella sp. HKS 07 TaxID=2712222 RepID=UPI0013E139BF|nr:hypothetical protein [Nordella sp. HKS 07]QIG49451.1 hypothetical protein G5V57_18050 [Nordella sp. HKS 07]
MTAREIIAALGGKWRGTTASKAGIQYFPVLGGVEALTIFADHDEDGGGLKAAQVCRSRWLAAGLECEIEEAPHG